VIGRRKEMKRISIASVVTATLFLPAIAADPPVFSSGFEDSDFNLGEMRGQNGWTVSPANTVAFVQGVTTYTGKQALAIGSRDGVSMAQRSITFDVHAGFKTNVAINLTPDFMNRSSLGRHAGTMVVGGLDTKGNGVALRFGIMQTAPKGFANLRGSMVYVFVEVEKNDKLIKATYVPMVNGAMSKGWHSVGLGYDASQHVANLMLDSKPFSKVFVEPIFSTVEDVSLGSEFSHSIVQARKATFFDDMMLAVD